MRGFDRGYERGAEAFFGNGLWFLRGLLLIVVVAAIVAAVIWFATRNRRAVTPASNFGHLGEEPLRLAAARYAAGEIDRDQFEQIRNDLLTTVTPPPSEPPAEA